MGLEKVDTAQGLVNEVHNIFVHQQKGSDVAVDLRACVFQEFLHADIARIRQVTHGVELQVNAFQQIMLVSNE